MESVKRRFNQSEKIGISLSGGLDSRAILAAVDQIAPNYPGVLYTFGSEDCPDIKIAKMVAARSKWQHYIFNSDSNHWLTSRYKMVRNTDGMLSIMHMHGAEMLESVASFVDVNLNGYCGDVVYGGGWIDRGLIGVRPSGENLKKHYFGFDATVDYSEPYFDLPIREIGLYPNRARRFTNMGVVNTLHAINHRLPFFGNQVLDVAFGIPEKHRYSNYAYSTMLKKCFPKYFVDIPWQKTGRPAAKLPRGMAKIPRLLVDRLSNMLRFSQSNSLKEGYAQYSHWIRNTEIFTELINLFNAQRSNMFPCSGVAWRKSYLDPHLENVDIDNSEKIMRTATLVVYFGSLNAHEHTQIANEKISKLK
jgi:asparagine synthase (glutamine-hydrolysing)